MVMNDNCSAMTYNTSEPHYNSTTQFHFVNEGLTRRIGECTTNVLGSSVIFECMGDWINEHVYIDATTTSPLPDFPDCSGNLLYTM